MGNQVVRGKVPFTPEEAGYQGERFSVLEKHFDKLLDEKKIVSASYCLSRNQKVFVDNGMGSFSYQEDDNKPFQPDTIFRIASITKVFTAVAMLKLAEDGLLRLDQPVADFIEEFNCNPYNKITIIHLLTHTSGLSPDGGAFENKYYSGWWKGMDDNDVKGTWITALLKDGLHRNPGEEWAYSTSGFSVAGEIISRVSGMDCHKYIEDMVVKPCEMEDTHFIPNIKYVDRYNIRTPWAEEMIGKLKEGTLDTTDDFIIPKTGGGLYSTCSDMVKFGEMILNNGTYKGKRVIGRKALEFMRIDHTNPASKDFCWGAPGIHRTHGVGPDIFNINVNKQQLITHEVIGHEGYGTCCLMIDMKEKFVATWTAQFNGENWYIEALRNVASIIWSGII